MKLLWKPHKEKVKTQRILQNIYHIVGNGNLSIYLHYSTLRDPYAPLLILHPHSPAFLQPSFWWPLPSGFTQVHWAIPQLRRSYSLVQWINAIVQPLTIGRGEQMERNRPVSSCWQMLYWLSSTYPRLVMEQPGKGTWNLLWVPGVLQDWASVSCDSLLNDASLQWFLTSPFLLSLPLSLLPEITS